MADKRKLNAEVERVMKKIEEGKETFDGLLKKFELATSVSQREKYGEDLKKEIKKLQRLRDSIKQWQGNPEIKDRESLAKARRDIESKMETFKVVERENKAKPYSKDGQNYTSKTLDPAERARIETVAWLEEQVEACEKKMKRTGEEIESIKTGKEIQHHHEEEEDDVSIEVTSARSRKDRRKKKKEKTSSRKSKKDDSQTRDESVNSSTKHDSTSLTNGDLDGRGDNIQLTDEQLQQTVELDDTIETFRTHSLNMRVLIRQLNNGQLQAEELVTLKDDMETFMDAAEHPRPYENLHDYDDIYDDYVDGVLLAEMTAMDDTAQAALIHAAMTSDCSMTNPTTSVTPTSSIPAGASSNTTIGMPTSVSANTPITVTQHSSHPPGYGHGDTIRMNGDLDTLSQSDNTAPSQQHSRIPGQTPSGGAPPNLSQQTSTATFDNSSQRSGTPYDATSRTGMKSPVSGAGSASGGINGDLRLRMPSGPAGSTGISATGPFDDSIHRDSPRSPLSSNTPHHANSPPGMSLHGQSQLSPAPTTANAWASGSKGETTLASQLSQLQIKQGTQGSSLSSQPQGSSAQPHLRTQQTSGQQGSTSNTGDNLNLGHSAGNSSNSSSSASSVSPNSTANARNAASYTHAHQTYQPYSAPDQNGLSTVHIPEHLALSPLAHTTQLTQEQKLQLQLVAAAQQHKPHPSDTEQKRNFIQRNPYQAPPHHILTPPLNIDSQEFYERLQPETLFFVFYYMERTKAQFLAAKALKKASWRFHTKYLLWFQRASEPTDITDEFEKGTYWFFDYENWKRRTKEDFKFEYQFLEDRSEI